MSTDNIADFPTLDATTPLDEVAWMVAGAERVVIDCGVIVMDGELLNEMMKIIRAGGIHQFELRNVCGQTLIGTGIRGPATIDVHGLMGNHSAAFIDGITLNSYATTFPNGVWCPGDAQVAIANTSNPTTLNIGGSVDDLFAAYTPSGIFRVAGQGGNRCVLRGGAGIPHAWREIDYTSLEGLSLKNRKELMLHSYQKRRARIGAVGWKDFLGEFRQKVEDRDPPVIVFGRRVRDYFMEYAQGTVGVILNVFDISYPVGYYAFSGMTAGRGYIRGPVSQEQLGERVKFANLTDDDAPMLRQIATEFHDTFYGRMGDEYHARLDWLLESFDSDLDKTLAQFHKIVPIDA